MTIYRLRMLRLQEGKNQEDLAKYLGVTKKYYNNYELGKRRVPIDVIIKIAKYYETTTDYVLRVSDVRSKVYYD